MEEILTSLNFPNHFIKYVMECITTPRFTLMLNGSTEGFFQAKTGLRQGDPMSPLLFVICMDYLSRILAYIGDMELFKFFKGCDRLKLNHLCFAGDLLLFSKGDVMFAYLLLQGLKLFSETSSLTANNSKSALYCSGMKEEDST